MTGLVCVGAAHRVKREGTTRCATGGGAFRAAKAAVACGMPSALVSLRGGDAPAAALARAIAQAGIEDLSVTFLTRESPKAVASPSTAGPIETIDGGLYRERFASQIRRIGLRERFASADAVLIDEHVPADAIARILKAANGAPVFAALDRTAGAAELLQAYFQDLRGVFLAGRGAGRIDLLTAGQRIAVAVDRAIDVHRLAGTLLALPGAIDDPAGALPAALQRLGYAEIR